jgi:hypothetical protein
LDAVGIASLDAAIDAAVDLVTAQWRQIMTVADALAEHGQLDRADVQRLLRPRATWKSPTFRDRHDRRSA